MFLLLLAVNLAVALVTTALVVVAFRSPIAGILGRIVQDPVAAAWRRYVTFALLVVGISSGVNPWDLQRYTRGGGWPSAPGERVIPGEPGALAPPDVAPLNSETWALEVYRTAISSLRGLAGALLLFFGIALVVSAIQRATELRAGPPVGLGSGRPAERMGGRGGGGRDIMARPGPRPAPDRRSSSGPDPRRRGSGEGRGPRDEPYRGGGGSGGGGGGDLRRREGVRGGGGGTRGGESRLGGGPSRGADGPRNLGSLEPRSLEPRSLEPRGLEPRPPGPRAVEPRAVEPRTGDPQGGVEAPAGEDDRRGNLEPAPGNGPQAARSGGPRRQWGR